ncbi:MAG: glycosyltransferase family 4 protein, partial [Cyanobacteria bacterium P01_F01_bin.4]
LGVEILNLHQSVSHVDSGNMPLIRTLHEHSAYCPSGSKFLQRWQRPCDRQYSFHGCMWGQIVDRCSSVRPQKIYQNFQKTRQETKTLPNITVMTVSHFLKQQMLASGYASDRVHALPLFAPDSLAQTVPLGKNGTPRFVFLGRFSPSKGLDWLLKSLAHISVPVHLDIAGEGFQEPVIKSLVKKLRLTDRVTFHGWVSADRANALICSARGLIFPSVWHEPAGLVALEAMKNARPVIASRVGGIPEMVSHHGNGLLVEPYDVEGLSTAMDMLAMDWSLAKRLGEQGQRCITQKFTLQKHLDGLMELYHQTIDRTQGGATGAKGKIFL